jgi:hypothetical protein
MTDRRMTSATYSLAGEISVECSRTTYFETPLTHYAGKTSVAYPVSLHFCTTRTTAVFERAVEAVVIHNTTTSMQSHALVVSDLANERAGSDDGESEPQAPYDADENSNDLVTEELRVG